MALVESDLDPDPFVQFTRWYEEARAAGMPDADAMTLATATPEGRPSARMVVLRGFDERGFVFFTNYESRKARELDENGHAALVFHWRELDRQVRAEGPVRRLDRDASARYFAQRPPGHRLSAWASPQGEVVASRDQLDRMFAEVEARFAGGDVPLPPFWGGYLLRPDVFEYWQARPDRLHDRLRYRPYTAGAWLLERLAP